MDRARRPQAYSELPRLVEWKLDCSPAAPRVTARLVRNRDRCRVTESYGRQPQWLGQLSPNQVLPALAGGRLNHCTSRRIAGVRIGALTRRTVWPFSQHLLEEGQPLLGGTAGERSHLFHALRTRLRVGRQARLVRQELL